jgi:error-prone DNA polymerase
MPPAEFVHLQVRSHYSLMRGAAGLEDLCRATRQRGMRALAVTDVNGLYGAVRFWEIARAWGLQPLLGAEVTAADSRRSAMGERATLLVRDRMGYANLCRILTRRHLDPAFSLARALAEGSQGLVVLCPSPAILETVRAGRGARDLYLALGASASSPSAMGGLERLRQARRLQVEPVAVNDVHLIDARDFELHRMLRSIALNTTRDRVPPEEMASPQAWLKSPAEMERSYPHCPEALRASERIAAECALAGACPLRDAVAGGARAARPRAPDHRRERLRRVFPGRAGDRASVAPHGRSRLRGGVDRLLLPRDHPRRADPP